MKYLFIFLCFAFSVKLLADPCQDAATGRLETSAQKKFLPFLEAQAKARLAGISSAAQYIEWQKDHPDMPSHPDQTYKAQWKGWGYFLGTGRVIGGKEDFLSFEKAREKTRLAGILSRAQYKEWQKDHPDMPSHPDQFYKGQWPGWGDFLGTGRVYKRREDILPFLEAREKVRLAGISTERQYRIWKKNHPDMPSNPNRAYPDQWTSWGDFLGTGRIKRKKENVLPFLEARAKARSAGISSSTKYRKWQRDQLDMPFNPPQFYKGQWPGWGDFLGTGRIYRKKEDILPFEAAREKARNAGISSSTQYNEWQKNHPDMPSNPNRAYPDQWPGWGDFLGTGRIYRKKEDVLPFEEAREKARNAGISSVAQYEQWRKDHPDMPSNPPQFYKGQWKGWGDFLGTGRVYKRREDILPFEKGTQLKRKRVYKRREDILPFERARAKAFLYGILSRRQYIEWQKDHPDMPSDPSYTYPDQWPGWGDFLGTGRIYNRREDILPFEKAQAKARLYRISSEKQYKQWQKAYPDMPSNPPQFYKGQWPGWGKFLGAERVKYGKNKKF